jgi:hypothetical protein
VKNPLRLIIRTVSDYWLLMLSCVYLFSYTWKCMKRVTASVRTAMAWRKVSIEIMVDDRFR